MNATPSDPSGGGEVRAVSLETLASEAGVSAALIERLVELDQIRPLADGRFDARDAGVLATVSSLEAAGMKLEDVEWAIESGEVGLSVVGRLFTAPPERTMSYATLVEELGPAGTRLGPIYAALGLPEPEPTTRPRADEARILSDYARMWASVDPAGGADVRVARLAGDGLRRLAEGWLDLWDAQARPSGRSQGAPTHGDAVPADFADPDVNPTVRAAALSRELVTWLFERMVERTLQERIINLVEGVLVDADRMPAQPVHPPAVAFVDLSGYTSLTEQRGDEVAAEAAAALQELAEVATRTGGGRIVKLLGDGVILRFDDPTTAVSVTLSLVGAIKAAGLPPGHAGIAAGRVVVRDGDVFGRVVNLAARISGHAGPGEVVVEEGVMAGSSEAATFESLGGITLKGFAQSVAVWRATKPAG